MLALPSLKTRLLLLGNVSPAINSPELVVLLHGLRRFNARIGRGLPALNVMRFMPSRGAIRRFAVCRAQANGKLGGVPQ